jgi:hypothetical protein
MPGHQKKVLRRPTFYVIAFGYEISSHVL